MELDVWNLLVRIQCFDSEFVGHHSSLPDFSRKLKCVQVMIPLAQSSVDSIFNTASADIIKNSADDWKGP